MSPAVVARRKDREGQEWTKAEALDWYGRARKKLGRRPTKKDMEPHARAFARLFGSVRKFQVAWGDEPGRRGRPRKQLLKEEVTL